MDVNEGAKGATTQIENPVRIIDLLCHTAGFSYGLGNSKLDNDVLKELYLSPHQNIESRVNALISMPLVGQPGAQW